MSNSPVKFSKAAVSKLIELQKGNNVGGDKVLVLIADYNLGSGELEYQFSYKESPDLPDERMYESNGYSYIVDQASALALIGVKIDYNDGHFSINLSDYSPTGGITGMARG